MTNLSNLSSDGGLPEPMREFGYDRGQAPDPDGFDLRGIWHDFTLALSIRWPLIAAATLGAVVMVMTYAFVWPPTYVAEVAVAASGEDPQREGFYDEWAVFRSHPLEDEVVLFLSEPVLKEVIINEDLKYTDVGHPPIRYGLYLWSESWLGKRWSDFKDVFRGSRSENEPTEEEVDFARTLVDFKEMVELKPVLDSSIGLLTVRGPTPAVADQANAIVDTYLRQRREHFAGEARAAADALRTETDKAYADLVAAEAAMESFYTENDMLLQFEKDQVEVVQYLKAKERASVAESEIARLVARLSVVDRLLATEKREIEASKTYQSDPIFRTYEQQLAGLKVQRETLAADYLPSSPEMRDLDRSIGVLERALADRSEEAVEQRAVVINERYETLRTERAQIEAALDGERAALAAIGADLTSRRGEIDRIPQKMKENHELGRQHAALERKYTLLQDRLMTAEVSAATAMSAPASLRVVQPATYPFDPVAPNKKLLLVLGVFLGAGMGTLAAMVLQHFHHGVTASGLERLSDNIPLFATLSYEAVPQSRAF